MEDIDNVAFAGTHTMTAVISLKGMLGQSLVEHQLLFVFNVPSLLHNPRIHLIGLAW